MYVFTCKHRRIKMLFEEAKFFTVLEGMRVRALLLKSQVDIMRAHLKKLF